VPREEVAARFAEQRELAALRDAYGRINEEKIGLEVRGAMERDLAEIRKIDPEVKSLDDLGPMYFELIGTGKIGGTEAYYAVKAREAKESKTPPPVIGKPDAAPIEKDFYTKEEIEAMSDDEVKKNLDKILSSQKKRYKG
jgi:hypothetical protein